MNALAKLMVCLGLALSAASLRAQTPQPDKAEARKEDAGKAIIVPFELLKSRHIAVEVKVNGKGPFRLIFDTGAPTNIVNNKLAKEAGLVKKEDKGGFNLFSMAGGKTIDELQIGDVKLDKVQVMVLDHPTVAALSNAIGPIDGLIGFPFFARFKTTIDYQKKELTFEPNGYVPGDAIQALMDKMMSAQGGKAEPQIVSPTGLWGFGIEKAKDDDEAGVNVKEVIEGSPSAIGGLKPGDRLLTLDGRWTDSTADTFLAASLVRLGQSVTLVVKRDGKEVKLKVKPVKGT